MERDASASQNPSLQHTALSEDSKLASKS